MRKSMTLFKKHAGVVVMSIATLLLLVGAAAFLRNTEIFSAKAGKNAVTSKSDIGSEKEAAVPGDLYARATADFNILAEGDVTEVPFIITHKAADGTDSPMLLDDKSYNQYVSKLCLSIYKNNYTSNANLLVDKIDPRADYDGSVNIPVGTVINVKMSQSNINTVNSDGFRVYYISDGAETDIDVSLIRNSSSGFYYLAQFVVPADIPADAKLVLNVPYINLSQSDMNAMTVYGHQNVKLTFTSVDDYNALDRMYSNITTDWLGNKTLSFTSPTAGTRYVFGGGKIKITPSGRYSDAAASAAFSVKALKVFAADENGDFTVDQTASAMAYDESDGSYTLTMPNHAIQIKTEVENTLTKNTVVVNSPNNECAAVELQASSYNQSSGSISFGGYVRNGCLFKTPDDGSNTRCTLSGTGGDFWTNPAAALTLSNAVYTISLKGKVNVNPTPYDLKDVKVEALGDDGVTYTDVTDTVLMKTDTHPSYTVYAYYIMLKPIEASLRITCTLEQRAAYKIYLSETPAVDGTRLCNEFYGNFLDANGEVASASEKKVDSTTSTDESGSTYLIGELCAGSNLYYRLYAYSDMLWTTLKSLDVWKLDEYGNKAEKLENYLPDRSSNPYGNVGTYSYYGCDSGGVHGFNACKQPMPECDILIEASYGDGRTPVLVEQYVVDEDGNESPAGESFTATFSGTPYDFGDGDSYAFINSEGNEIDRAPLTETLSDIAKINSVTAVSTVVNADNASDSQNHYWFYRRKDTSSVDIDLKMPSGYIANITAGYGGLYKGNPFYRITKMDYTKNDSGKYAIDNKYNETRYSWKIVIRYSKYSPITVVQKTGGVVVDGNVTVLGTVTLTHDAENSANANIIPFSGFEGIEAGRSAGSLNNDGTAAKAYLKLLSKEQTNTLTAAMGTKLKIQITPDAQRIIKSVKAYVTKDGVESEFPLTTVSSSYTAATYTADELITFDSEIRIEVEYAVADKIKVEVLCTNDEGKLVSNTTDASVTVTGSGAITPEGAFQEVGGTKAWIDSFTVTTSKTVSTIGNTKLEISVDLPADSGYVLANVYAFQMNNSGNPNGETSPIIPMTLEETVGGFYEVRDFSQCSFTMTGGSVLIRVYLAKTATVNVSFRSRSDDGEFSTDNIPDVEGTYITYTSKSTTYGTKSYPVIVENKYNVESYTLTKSPASRTVHVLEKNNIAGTISLPRGYVIASIITEEIKTDGTASKMSYNFSNFRFSLNGEQYLYQANFSVGSTITAGYTYNVTVNIEKATGIKFESYHSSENGFVPNVGQSNCTATLYGERTSADPAYASILPFSQGRANNSKGAPEGADHPISNITTNIGRSSYDYYVLQDTALRLTAKPIDGEIISNVKVYFENDPQNLIEVTETAKDEDGTVHYSISQNTKLSDVMVVEVYFSADLSGSITIENVTTDGNPLPDTCYTRLNIGNETYSKPIYDVINDEWSSTVQTNAASTQYKIMTNSKGGVNAVIGGGYILESCEIRYHDEDEYKDFSNASSNSKSKSYLLGANLFSSDKKITIRNTYRPGADFTIYEHRDLNESISWNLTSCAVTASNPDTRLTNGPLYINNKSYTSTYTATANRSTGSISKFMVAKDSSVSLSVSEPRDYGYTLDRIELRKDGALVETKYRADLAPSVDEQLTYSLPGITEQLTGEGYQVDIYYKADYVSLTQECVDSDGNFFEECKKATVTFSVAWSESNPMIQDRVANGESADGQLEGTIDDATPQGINFTVGLLDGATDYKVNIAPNNYHRIKEIWYGASPSTMKLYDELPELDFGQRYTFEALDELGVTDMKYIKILYDDIINREHSAPVEPPAVERNRGLLTVNVYEDSANGYQLSTANQIKITFAVPADNSEAFDYVPQLYENEVFTDLEPSESNANVYYFNLPYADSGSAMFSAFQGTNVTTDVTPDPGCQLEKVVLINQSKGTSSLIQIYINSDGTYRIDPIGISTENRSLNFYFSKPTLEIGTNNTAADPKGSVELNGSNAIASNEYMKAFKFDRGSTVNLTAKPTEGYEFAYILSGSSRTNMAVVDSSKVTVNADGTADIDFGELYNDTYVQIQFNSQSETAYSQINVAHYKEDESGSYVLSTEGRVHVSGIHSNIPEPFLVDGSTADYVDLTTEGQIITESASGTKLTVSVTQPENCIVSDFKAMYYDENGQVHDIEYTKSGNSYDLSQAVVLNSTVFIEVYYQGGYSIYYHGSGCSGTVPVDETVYYSGDSATVLGKGEMIKEHNSFLGWSTMSGKNSANEVEYNEGDSITFSSGDIHLYAVWGEEASYRVVYHADDKESGSVPIDGKSYYLNQEAAVLDNPEANPLTKTGYTFAGWSLKKADNTSVLCNAGDNVKVIAENLTTADGATAQAVNLYAVWNENSYKLTYDENTTDTVTDMPDPSSVSWKYTEVGGMLTLSGSTPKRTGYTFKEWNTKAGGDGTAYAPNAEITKTAADIILYAVWTENSYKLTYDKNTADTVTDMPNPLSANWMYTNVGEQLTLSDSTPKRTGYVFKEWNTKAGGDGTAYAPNAEITKTAADITLYAVWNENSYTLTYNKNTTDTVTDMPDPSSVSWKYTEIGGMLTLSGSTPKRTGYTFKEWNTKPGGDGTAYAPNAEITKTAADIILYAVWTENSYTLTYNQNTADTVTDMPNPLSASWNYTDVGGKLTLSDSTPKRTGYVFKEWNTKAGGDGTAYAPNAEITKTAADITLYAVWNENSYTLTYNKNTTDTVTDMPDPLSVSWKYTEVGGMLTLSGSTPKRTGYTFKEWNTKAGGDGTAYAPNAEITKTAADIILYAVWTENSYKLTYNQNTADTVTDMPNPLSANWMYTNVGEQLTLSDSTPKRTGYVFKEWNTKAGGDGTAYAPNAEITKTAADITLYAIWNENSYTLTYDKNTTDTVTDIPDPSSVSWKYTEVGGMLTLSGSTPKRTGYTFKEWNTKSGGNGTAYAPNAEITKTAADITLYAVWNENSYTLDYQTGAGHSSAVIPDDEENLPYTDIKDGKKLSSNVPVDTGYTFAGWQVNGVDGTLNAGANVPFASFDNDGKTATAVATWTLNKHWVKYEITVPSDISYIKPGDEQKSFGETVDVAAEPTGYDRDKYTFSGWSSTDVTIDASGSFTMPDKDVIIRGSFTENGKVTLIYDANGATSGTAPAPVSQYTKVVEKIKGQGDLLRTGYTFDGWNASANGDSTVYAVDTTHTFTENTTIYAKWTPNEYHVRYYDINGNELTDLAQTCTYGTDFTVRPKDDIPSVTGKEIVGWRFKGGMAQDADGTPITGSGTYQMPAGDVQFQAEYKDIYYTVTYQVSNAPSSYDVPETKSYKYKADVAVADIPNITGYSFIGWKCDQVDASGTSFTMPAENVLITGVFTEKDKVTLTYDANGATAGTVPASVTDYDKVVENIKGNVGNLEKTGYTFDGWKDANGTAYTIGNEYTFTQDTVLYAQWKKASFKVEYYEADGTTLIATHTYGYKDLVSVGNGVTPTIGAGKVWNGEWVLINTAQRDADNVEIGARNNYPMPAETVKYKAVLDTKTYTVTYIMEGDMPGDLSYVPPAAATYNHGDTVNVAAFPTGYDTSEYKFTGWDYNGSGTYYADGTSKASFTITENVVLKGVWEKLTPPAPDKVTVTYVSGVTGDDITDASLNITRVEQVTIGNDYTVHDNEGWTNYVRPGYRFVNWKVAAPEITGLSLIDNLIARFAGPANLGQEYVSGDTITDLIENVTLEAQWEQINYTVTYDGNGATGGTVPVDSNSYAYNDIAVVKDKRDLVKDGFIFKGWNTSPLGTGTALYSPNDEITVTSDITLYAIWSTEPKPNTYRVIYDKNGATSGTVPEDNTDYKYGETVTVKDKETLAKTGCTFKEWNTKPNGKGKGYGAGNTFTMPKSDVTLYAIWINGDGNIVVSPGTGESSVGLQLAIGAMILSVLAGGCAAVNFKRKKNIKDRESI